jgi:signal transduction histidine kinase
MSNNKKQRSSAWGPSAWFALLCLGILPAAHAQSNCLPVPDEDLQSIQSLIAADPRKALTELQSKIAELQLDPAPDPRRLASLYALEAQGYEILEFDLQAVTEATKGLVLVPEQDDPLHLNLLMTVEENIDGELALSGAVASIEAARSSQQRGTLADTCLLITLGMLQMRSNHPERGIVDLTEAYRTSAALGLEDARVMAADSLSSVMGLLGDYDEALALNQEVVDWATAHGASLSLSVASFERGKLFRNMHSYEAAREQQEQARKISVQLDDTQGIAYADIELCQIEIELGHLTAARPLCDNALRAFTQAQAIDVAKEAMLYLARIDVEEHRADRALDILNRVLDQRGADMYAPRATQAYLWRSRANAALARDRDAYTDLAEYTRRMTELADARSTSNAAAMRVKFEMNAKDQELERVRSEAAAARLEVSRRSFERNLVAASAALLVFTVLSVTWLWRRRKQTDDMRRAAEDRLALIGRLTGGVAHEFNNLMTVIQQAVGLLAQREAISADSVAGSLVGEIQQASNVCADVTTQLLSFARQQNLKPETFFADEFLTKLLPALRMAEGPTVDFEIRCDEPGLAIHADARQFKAVLLHLVGNARDSMARGGKIAIRAVGESGRFVRIDIVDEGCGMSAQTLEHAVEPFFTTKPIGAGSGLGLSVADGFMRQSGGTMTITSAPGAGTTVSLHFPRAKQSS